MAYIDPAQPGPGTVDTLAVDLRALGVASGSTLVVRSSLSALGYVTGGAHAVVLALRDVLGPDGTLVVPTHSSSLSDPGRWENPPVPETWWPVIRESMPAFDPALTPTGGMGAVVEVVRHLPGALRSAHPVDSFCAVGPNAVFVTSHHGLANGLGEESPLARLYDLGADVLLLGVGHANNTSLHLGEFRSHIRPTVTEGAPVLVDGRRAWVTYRYPTGTPRTSRRSARRPPLPGWSGPTGSRTVRPASWTSVRWSTSPRPGSSTTDHVRAPHRPGMHPRPESTGPSAPSGSAVARQFLHQFVRLASVAHHHQARMGGVRTGPGRNLLVVPVHGPPRPQHHIAVCVDRHDVAEGLSVPVPQVAACDCPQDRSPGHLRHHGPPRGIEDDDELGSGPHQVPHLVVVPVDHPAVAAHLLGDPAPEGLRIEWGPSRLVEVCVELGVWHPHPVGQGPGQGRLAATRRPVDGDTVDRGHVSSVRARRARPGAPPARRTRPPPGRGTRRTRRRRRSRGRGRQDRHRAARRTRAGGRTGRRDGRHRTWRGPGRRASGGGPGPCTPRGRRRRPTPCRTPGPGARGPCIRAAPARPVPVGPSARLRASHRSPRSTRADGRPASSRRPACVPRPGVGARRHPWATGRCSPCTP